MENNQIENEGEAMSELVYIRRVLQEAQKEGLAIEVVWSALQAMRNPNITIQEAMQHGFSEWIK